MVCSGGTKAGGNNGAMKGCPAGLAGAGSPALMSGLPAARRRSYVLILTNPGLVPVRVPVQAVGTRAEPVGIQLFDPSLTLPDTHFTLVSRTILSMAAPPTRKKTLLCTSRLSIP